MFRVIFHIVVTAVLLLQGVAAYAHTWAGEHNEFVEGSGWVHSQYGGHKALFGIAGGCKSGGYHGHFVFKDKSLNLWIKDAHITSISSGGPDTRIIEGTGKFEGSSSYNSNDGTFRAVVKDNGDKTPDSFHVDLSTGYSADGSLGNGNIRHHRHPGKDECPPDTTAPTVSITSPAEGTTVSGTVTIKADASDNREMGGVKFYVDGAAVGSEDTSAPYSVSWDTTAVSNGSHSLTAVARDASDNTTTSSSVTVTVQNADTTSPTVSLTSPANGATVSGTVSVSANASDDTGVAGVQFYADGAAVGSEDTSAPYSASWDTTAVSNGSHSLTAVARDAAGNTTTSSAVTVTVDNGTSDTTPPSVTVTAPADGATVSGTVSISANASDDTGVAGVQFYADGAAVGSEDTSAPYSVNWDTTAASNGSHSLTAVARDAAGNTTTSSAVTVTVDNGTSDTTPPSVTVTAPADGATVSGTITISADASDANGVDRVQFLVDGTQVGSLDTSAPYSVSWDTTAVADGSHTIQARAQDPAGNIGESTVINVTVSNGGGTDSTPPSVSITSPSDGATVSGTVSVTANASDDTGVAGVQFYVDGNAVGAEDSSAPYSVNWDSTGISDGSHSLTAIAMDAAGNTATSTSVNVTVSNGGGTTTRIEETDPAVSYTSGSWMSVSDSTVSGGTAVESNTAGATATVSFNGTAITWIGYRCTCASGIANIYVDGTEVATVDTYSASREPQAPIYTASGLSPGSHTFTIEVTGNYNRSGNTAYIVVDAFDIQQ